MRIFSFHLVDTKPLTGVSMLTRLGSIRRTQGLIHIEFMGAMTLGAPILSSSRFQIRNLAVFALWESEPALNSFLVDTAVGRVLSKGWHVRLKFLRKWGHFSDFGEWPVPSDGTDESLPVVAVTIARLKIPEVLRFFRWGKPVEELVRDHPGKTLATAAFRFPRTFSTFSVWSTQRDMTDMVRGRGSQPGGTRHADAMAERTRKDFHHQFATYRFRGLSEHGVWKGRGDYLPPIN